MDLKLDVSEAVSVANRIAGAGGRIGAVGSAVLRRTAYAIQADAQALAPVDTGALRESISTSIDGDGRSGHMAAEIGPTVEYGIYLEFGTSVMPGQPYMTPAFDRQVPSYADALAAAAAAEVL